MHAVRHGSKVDSIKTNTLLISLSRIYKSQTLFSKLSLPYLSFVESDQDVKMLVLNTYADELV